MRVLDIGTGAADIPAALIDRFAKHGMALTMHAIDTREEMVELAAERGGERPDPDVGGDHRGRPLAVRRRDCSTSPTVPWWSTTWSPTAVTGLLREAGRVGGLGVIVNDLDRTPYSGLAPGCSVTS